MTERSMPPSVEHVLAETRAWLLRAVVGLNLCPFAKAPLVRGRIRCVASAATDAAALLEELCGEMRRLVATDPAEIETTLLIHPAVLTDFDLYNDFLDSADGALERLGLDGVLQVASFHPQYRFAGTEPDDLGNATNRSPYPMLQLLRESSVERALASFPDAGAIYQTNLRMLEVLGAAGWEALRAQCVRDAAESLRQKHQ